MIFSHGQPKVIDHVTLKGLYNISSHVFTDMIVWH